METPLESPSAEVKFQEMLEELGQSQGPHATWFPRSTERYGKYLPTR